MIVFPDVEVQKSNNCLNKKSGCLEVGIRRKSDESGRGNKILTGDKGKRKLKKHVKMINYRNR